LIHMNERNLVSIIAVSSVVLLLFSGWGMSSHMLGLGYMGMWGGMGLGMGLFWVLALIGVYMLFTTTRPNTELDRAKSIARERYARGEISEEEYKKIINHL